MRRFIMLCTLLAGGSFAAGQSDVEPPLLIDPAGQAITTPQQWQAERERLLEAFASLIYGRVPSELDKLSFEVTHIDRAAMDGKATLKQIDIRCEKDGRAFSFPMILFVPNHRDGPARVMLLINNRPPSNTDPTRGEQSEFWPAEMVIGRGYAVAAIHTSDIVPDDTQIWRDRGAVHLFAKGQAATDDSWGAIAAWAWGASRAMDYIETDDDLDAKHVALIGHSRGGKTALWAAANDTRFAIAVSNNSGCTGAALAHRMQGETIEKINGRFPYWFCRNYKAFDGRDDQLPIDQHQLLAAIAPRGLYVASAAEDDWADPQGEFLALKAASQVYALHGFKPIDAHMPAEGESLTVGPMAYHLAPGKHSLSTFGWSRFLDFADGLWKQHTPP